MKEGEHAPFSNRQVDLLASGTWQPLALGYQCWNTPSKKMFSPDILPVGRYPHHMRKETWFSSPTPRVSINISAQLDSKGEFISSPQVFILSLFTTLSGVSLGLHLLLFYQCAFFIYSIFLFFPFILQKDMNLHFVNPFGLCSFPSLKEGEVG